MSMVKTLVSAVTGGVDTHADTHVAAALDGVGGLLGVSEFPATPARATVPNPASQPSRPAYPAAVAGNSRTPSRAPRESSAAAT